LEPAATKHKWHGTNTDSDAANSKISRASKLDSNMQEVLLRNDLKQYPMVARCMMALLCWFTGSLIIWGAGGFWGAAAGVCFAGMGFIALWLWPQWSSEPGLRLFRDMYMTMWVFFASMALHSAGVMPWLALGPTVAFSLELLRDVYISWARDRQQNPPTDDLQRDWI
jgi:hypothetical protein